MPLPSMPTDLETSQPPRSNVSETQPTALSTRILSSGVVLLLGLLLLISLSLLNGPVDLSIAEAWQALLKQGNATNQVIVWELRLPRIVAAIAVGAALGVSGALLQGMLRNGLASPFILGISAGSGLAAIALVTLGVFQAWVPVAAWLGGLVTTGIVFFLSWSGNGVGIERLILAGVAVSSLLGAVQTLLLLLAEDGRVQAALSWLVGTLNGRGWADLQVSGLYILAALLLSLLLANLLNVLSLGDELAMGLGLSVTRSRLLIGAVATLLAASAVSVAGLVGFVGLVVPHGVRLLVGTDYRWVIPFSALGGAIILCLADLIARWGAIELPVGVITAILGAPVFIGLLYRRSATARRTAA